MNTMPHKSLPVTEAAKVLGVTRSYLTRLLRTNRISGRKLTTVVWEVDASSLDKYRRARKCS